MVDGFVLQKAVGVGSWSRMCRPATRLERLTLTRLPRGPVLDRCAGGVEEALEFACVVVKVSAEISISRFWLQASRPEWLGQPRPSTSAAAQYNGA